MSGAVRFDMHQQRAALNRIRAEIKGYLETMIANRILMNIIAMKMIAKGDMIIKQKKLTKNSHLNPQTHWQRLVKKRL